MLSVMFFRNKLALDTIQNRKPRQQRGGANNAIFCTAEQSGSSTVTKQNSRFNMRKRSCVYPQTKKKEPKQKWGWVPSWELLVSDFQLLVSKTIWNVQKSLVRISLLDSITSSDGGITARPALRAPRGWLWWPCHVIFATHCRRAECWPKIRDVTLSWRRRLERAQSIATLASYAVSDPGPFHPQRPREEKRIDILHEGHPT